MDSAPRGFEYSLAFSRNLGWFKPEDQELLRTKRIAIPGLGGVGGHHLHNFLRLGFQKFNIADPDIFEVQNFNRQMGASLETVGSLKTDVLERMAKTINPDVQIRCFKEGITKDNQNDFLQDVDIIVDALDLYAMDIRISLYEAAHRKGIPVVTAGPFGMGTAIMAFSPNRMSFNQYFDFNQRNLTVEAKIIRFLAGLTPNLMHQKYLRYKIAVDLFERRLPSLNIGCLAAAAAMGAMVTKILLNPNDPNIRWAPYGFHADFHLQTSIRFWRPWGNKNPLQKLKIKIYHRFFRRDEYQK